MSAHALGKESEMKQLHDDFRRDSVLMCICTYIYTRVMYICVHVNDKGII